MFFSFYKNYKNEGKEMTNTYIESRSYHRLCNNMILTIIQLSILCLALDYSGLLRFNILQLAILGYFFYSAVLVLTSIVLAWIDRSNTLVIDDDFSFRFNILISLFPFFAPVIFEYRLYRIWHRSLISSLEFDERAT